MNRKSPFVIALASALLLPQLTFAANRVWDTASSHFFDETISWTGGVIPAIDGSDSVTFNKTGSPFNVFFDEVTVGIYGGEARVSDATVSNATSVSFITTSGPRRALNVTGVAGGAANNLIVTDTSLLQIGVFGSPSNAFEVNVGQWVVVEDSSALYVYDGSALSSTGEIRLHDGASALVSGSGSTWHSDSRFYVGITGEGTFTIAEGADVTSNGDFASIGEDHGSTGFVTVTGSGSTWDVANSLDVGFHGSGTLTVSDGATVFAQNLNINSLSELRGNGGFVSADVTSHGNISPGESVGELTILGSLDQEASGVINIDIASTSSYDLLGVDGLATLAGSIDVSFLGGFIPTNGDTFDVVKSSNNINAFALQSIPGFSFSVIHPDSLYYLRLTAAFSLADFNFDGFVDGADFSFFLGQWGAIGGLGDADFNSDTTVDGADFSFFLGEWNPEPPPAAAFIPEPASLTTLTLAAVSLLLRRHRT